MKLGRAFIRLMYLSALLYALAGCTPSFQVVKPDPVTGLLPTGVQVKPEEITHYKPSAVVHDLKFVVLDTHSIGMGTNEFGGFMLASLKEFGFPKLITRDELAQLVLSSPLRDSVGNVTDPVALAKISDALGPFLLIDVLQAFKGEAWFETVLQVRDPARAEALLGVHRVRLNWMNMDKEVNYPILNVLKRWLDESRALSPVAPVENAAKPLGT